MSPALVVCMGVSGVGKSTYARLISDVLELPFLEADDIHSTANKQKMRSGVPLTEADREPWMADVCIQINAYKRESGCVIAHSALRRNHREQLRGCEIPTYFIHLHAPKEIIKQRMAERQDHFMPATLVDSQFRTLEPTTGEPDVFQIDASPEIDEVSQAVYARSQYIKTRINL